MFPDFSTEFAEAIHQRLGTDGTVIHIDDVGTARFFGAIMHSALQERLFLKYFEAGSLHVWAINVEGRIYGAGITINEDGDPHRLQSAFAPSNAHDETTEAIDHILDGLTVNYAGRRPLLV